MANVNITITQFLREFFSSNLHFSYSFTYFSLRVIIRITKMFKKIYYFDENKYLGPGYWVSGITCEVPSSGSH